MPRAVVTGGAGFIGSHLCERLVADGWTVVCLDNLITGAEENNASLHGRGDVFSFQRADVSNEIHVDGPVDWIFHFASPASPVDYAKFPIQTLKVGSLGTHNALGLAKAKNAGFTMASTSEVYGDPEENPQRETYWGHVNPVGPRGCYDEAKRFAEAMVMAYHRVHNLNTRIVRIFNTYGPRMRLADGRVVPNFVSQALRNEPITVYGEGSQTRSFCYVDDLVDGIVRLSKASRHEPVNIGNPREFSILQFAQLVVKMTGSRSEIVHRPLPIDDPKQRRPDITLARELLGWEPKVELEEGLARSVAYFRERIGAPA